MLYYALVLLAMGKLDQHLERRWDAPLAAALLCSGPLLLEGRVLACVLLALASGALAWLFYGLLRRLGDRIALWALAVAGGALLCSGLLAVLESRF